MAGKQIKVTQELYDRLVAAKGKMSFPKYIESLMDGPTIRFRSSTNDKTITLPITFAWTADMTPDMGDGGLSDA